MLAVEAGIVISCRRDSGKHVASEESGDSRGHAEVSTSYSLQSTREDPRGLGLHESSYAAGVAPDEISFVLSLVDSLVYSLVHLLTHASHASAHSHHILVFVFDRVRSFVHSFVRVHSLILSLVHPLELTHVGGLTYAISTVRTRSYMFFVHSLGAFSRMHSLVWTHSLVRVCTHLCDSKLAHTVPLVRTHPIVSTYSCILVHSLERTHSLLRLKIRSFVSPHSLRVVHTTDLCVFIRRHPYSLAT